MSMMGEQKVIKLSQYKRISCNIYKRRVYVHFNEIEGKKSITLSAAEFESLCKYFGKLKKTFHGLKTKAEKGKKKKSFTVSSSDERESDRDTTEEDSD